MNFTQEEKIAWLSRFEQVKLKELPFTFEKGEDRGFIKSQVYTEMKLVPIFGSFGVCDDYDRYMRKIDQHFEQQFKKHLLSL